MWAVYMGWWSAAAASGVIGLGTWSRGVLRGRLGDETDCSGSMCSGCIGWCVGRRIAGDIAWCVTRCVARCVGWHAAWL